MGRPHICYEGHIHIPNIKEGTRYYQKCHCGHTHNRVDGVVNRDIPGMSVYPCIPKTYLDDLVPVYQNRIEALKKELLLDNKEMGS